MQNFLGKDSVWIIDWVIDHNISISKYNPSAGSSYAKLLKELYHPRKRLINIQNIDVNKCFKWCLVRYLNPADHKLARVTKGDQDFSKERDFKNIHKIEKKRILPALVLLIMKIRKNIQFMYQKNVVKKNISIYY